MADQPILELDFVDVYGKPLNEKVDIVLRHQELSETVRLNRIIKGPIDLTGLRGRPQGHYKVNIDPPSYRPAMHFVDIMSSGTTLLRAMFPVNLSKITSVNFPAYQRLPAELKTLLENSKRVKGFEGSNGRNLYEAMSNEDPRRAGLLNIAAKTGRTLLSSGKTILSQISELIELRGDRFFAIVPQKLREDTKDSIASGIFHEAGELLHHPPDGYAHAGSFKTKDRYGNLQLTFFAGPENWVADIDIDDASGIEHIFQVIVNSLPGRDTNPYNIHEILLGYQKIDPGYSFKM